ncbi:MAG: hypothetical protein R3C32_04595 [Chloroflexota bacterium]
MPRPIVVILHRPADPVAPPLTHLLATARGLLVEHQRRLFRRAGADRVLVVTDRAASFGERLGDLARRVPRRQGIVVLGSGAVPLLRPDDVIGCSRRRRVGPPRPHQQPLLVGCVCRERRGRAPGLPALPTDNALPRWLEEHRGYRVREMPGRRRLGWTWTRRSTSPCSRTLAPLPARCARWPTSLASASRAWSGSPASCGPSRRAARRGAHQLGDAALAGATRPLSGAGPGRGAGPARLEHARPRRARR